MGTWEEARSIPIGDVAHALGLPRTRGSMSCPTADHDDRHPSFSIDARKNRCFCFGCGRGGSTIDLVSLVLGISAPDAVDWLRDHFFGSGAQLRIPAPKLTVVAEKSSGIVVFDQEVYSWVMAKYAMTNEGQAYLTGRSITEQTTVAFKLGFLENASDLQRDLLSTFGVERSVRAGLLIQKANKIKPIFQRRSVLFPYLENGLPVYIQARATDPLSDARWMGLGGIPKPMFNLDAIADSKQVYICEGALDVLSAYELGLTAIGLPGAASRIPKRVLSALRGRTVYIIPDIDRAGRGMAEAALASLRGAGVQAVVQRLPRGSDLNEYLSLTRGLV